MSSIDECICIKDFELLADKSTPPQYLLYLNTGAMDEQTQEENQSAFKKWRFQPRCLRDVSKVSLKTTILGQDLNFPIGIAPTGQIRLFSSDGEIGVANVTANLGTVFTESTHASDSIEDIAAGSPTGLKWFQSEFFLDRNLTKSLIERAEKNGVTTIVLSVDVAFPGKRIRLMKSKEPLQFTSTNLDHLVNDWHSLSTSTRDHSQSCGTWKDFEWLKSLTSLPIIVKGILTPQMAVEAVDHGAAAVWISNHGGRKFDGVLPTIYALPSIAKAIKGKCPIIFDGGIRSGGDVAKAIALGADCVFVGRPAVWGIASGGAAGAKKVLEILRDELELTMKLLGVTSIKELQSDPNLVVHESKIIESF